MDRHFVSRIVITLAALLAPPLTAGPITMYLSAPGVQTNADWCPAGSPSCGSTVINFDSLTAGNVTAAPYVSAIGTYEASLTTPFNVQAANQYGGAGGTGKYFAVGVQSNSTTPVALDLNTLSTYFGLWWSAGDAYNGLSFYSGGTLIQRETTADVVTLLNHGTGTISAANGNVYNTSAYFGNPNANFPGMDSGEPFAFLSFVSSTPFDRVVFDNSGSLASGFESDNHTLISGTYLVPDSAVQVGATPESSSMSMAGGGLLAFLLVAAFRYYRKL